MHSFQYLRKEANDKSEKVSGRGGREEGAGREGSARRHKSCQSPSSIFSVETLLLLCVLLQRYLMLEYAHICI